MKTVEFLQKDEELFSSKYINKIGVKNFFLLIKENFIKRHPLLKGFYLEIKEDFEKGITTFIFYFDEWIEKI